MVHGYVRDWYLIGGEGDCGEGDSGDRRVIVGRVIVGRLIVIGRVNGNPSLSTLITDFSF